MTTHKYILRQVQAEESHLVELRRWFHQHPETAREEFKTQAKIEKELDNLGLPHGRTCGTGVWADIHGLGEGTRSIVLRADMDALSLQELSDVPYKSTVPGKMHACGHDAHTAALLGAARILFENRERFGGIIRLIFQPAEEIGYGGRAVIREGYLDGFERSFGLHLAPSIPVGSVAVVPGPNNASCDWFRIVVKGTGAHISTPHNGVDALQIASRIAIGANALTTPHLDQIDSVLVGVGKLTAGTAYNVIASDAEVIGTIRAFTHELRKKAQEDLIALSGKTAALFGGHAEVELHDFATPLCNDAIPCREVQKTVADLWGEEHLITSRPPSLTADDMADFILSASGCYAYVGSSNPLLPSTCSAQHSSTFDIDERCLSISASLYIAYAMDYLNGLFD